MDRRACPQAGASPRKTRSARSAERRCRWGSTAPRTTRRGCCCSATPAAWSPRSTARASPTPWSPPASRPNSSSTPRRVPPRQAGARRRRRAAGRIRGLRPGPVGLALHPGAGLCRVIGKPAVMKLALRTGMPIPVLMKFVVRLLANLTDPSAKGIEDRISASWNPSSRRPPTPRRPLRRSNPRIPQQKVRVNP